MSFMGRFMSFRKKNCFNRLFCLHLNETNYK
nr:MAG TPA: hypothetical protein [Bacteriophage sp.]